MPAASAAGRKMLSPTTSDRTIRMDTLKLDPATTALVLIDLQVGIVAMNVAPRTSAEVVANSAKLAAACRAAGAMVVVVRVANLPDGGDMLAPPADAMAPAGTRPANWSTIVPEIGMHDGDLQITKRQWGAFYGTELDLQLRRRGIRTIVLAGLSTNVGVESTARDAFERGYSQVFVEDAMASPSAEAHAGTLKFIFPRIGYTRSTQVVLDALGAAKG
jgi:nicotinamidase-related amidase